jgi:dihydrofolate reductase
MSSRHPGRRTAQRDKKHNRPGAEDATVARLIYSAIASLDGYIEDATGGFDWAQPDAEVHAAVNDLERPIGTYLYGRRMYETMTFWETGGDDDPISRDFAGIWRKAEKVVYSRTLDAVTTSKTRLESDFDADAVRKLKASSSADIGVGGAQLAAAALAAGLVDELHLFLNPIVVGGGKPALPDAVRIPLQLVGERRFAGGVVHLHYRLNSC